MTLQNPFKTLGIGPDASPEEAHAAYRRLAKESHPNACPNDPGAAERFMRLREAYEAVRDGTARRSSGANPFEMAFEDIFGSPPPDGRRQRSQERRRRGADARRVLDISLHNAFHGGTFALDGTAGSCGTCGGSGRVETPEDGTCANCGGAGSLEQVRGILTIEVACHECDGSGQSSTILCEVCGGSGRDRAGSVEVQIPAGCADGAEIRMRELGAPGVGGAYAGDLVVTVRIAPHDDFVRDGNDLLTALTIPVWDAALGCARELRTIDGRVIRLTIPEGCSPGRRVRVRGLGMPRIEGGRGDLIVRIDVHIPRADGKMLELYERMRSVVA